MAWQRWAADGVVLLHFAFVLFVVFGGLAVLRRPRLAWVHLPVAIYGVAIEWIGWVCPLTPLENRLRDAAGQAGYEGGFVEHYLLPVLYPTGLTPAVQWVLGALVFSVNFVIYWRLIVRPPADDTRTPKKASLPMRELRPCPDSPNCAASVGPGALDPIPFDGPVAVARERLAEIVRAMPRTTIVEETQDYLHAEVRSEVLGFVDDLELSFDEAAGVVHFRAKSRTGYWDLGVNRRRVDDLRRAFTGAD